MNFADKDKIMNLLKGYKELLDQNLITQEEYEKMRAEALAQLSKTDEDYKKEERIHSSNKKRMVLTIINLVSIFAAVFFAVVAIAGLVLPETFASQMCTINDIELYFTADTGYALIDFQPWSIVAIVLMGLFIATAVAVLVVFLIQRNKGKLGPIVQLASSVVLLIASIVDMLSLISFYKLIDKYNVTFATLDFYGDHLATSIAFTAFAAYLIIYNVISFVLILKEPKE